MFSFQWLFLRSNLDSSQPRLRQITRKEKHYICRTKHSGGDGVTQQPRRKTYATTGQNCTCTGCAHAYKISMAINAMHTNGTPYEPPMSNLATEPIPKHSTLAASYMQSLARVKTKRHQFRGCIKRPTLLHSSWHAVEMHDRA
jgi:hypothetical protein